jgi:hypothetical protein
VIDKDGDEYELICDHCGMSKKGFDTFNEAVQYKKIKKWRAVKTETQGWVDLCPECVTPGNIAGYREK